MSETKTCKQCQLEKAVQHFQQVNKFSNGGYEYICKKCRKENRKLNLGVKGFATTRTGRTSIYHSANTPKWAKTLFANNSRRYPKKHYENRIFLRDLDYDADFLAELYEKQQGKCFYSGIEMKLDGEISPERISLDRIHSEQCYSRDNIVLCCYAINLAKSSYSPDIFLAALKSLKEYGKVV